MALTDPTAPRVWVIIVNWNGAEDTVCCLDALQRLEYPNYDTVIVDNASTDNSVAKIRARFPSLEILVSDTNLGFSGGSNIGIRHALSMGADYVWLLNNDTEVAPAALAALVATAQRDQAIGAVASVLYDFVDRERVQVWGGGIVNVIAGTTRVCEAPFRPNGVSYLCGGSLLVRREALKSVGLLDEGYFMYWEDADLSFALRRRGWKLAIAPASTVWHKGSASTGGQGSSAAYDLYCRSAVRFLCRYAPVPALAIAIRALGGSLKWSLKRDWNRARIALRSLTYLKGAPCGS